MYENDVWHSFSFFEIFDYGECIQTMDAGQNAPKGVEKVHYECRIDIESNDRGNSTL